MSRLEDALRATFDADLDPHSGPMLEDIRRGARRRRTRRNAAVAAAAVSVLVAGIAVGGTLLGSGDGPPQPAPGPTQSNAPRQPATASPGAALAVEAGAGGVLLAIGNDPACTCSVLYRYDGDWQRVHEFPEEYVERFVMAPNGRDGWAAAPGGRLWATHDGGEVWRPVDVPRAAGVDASYLFTATSTYVLVVDVNQARAWRAPVASDALEPVGVGAGANVIAISTVGEAVVVDTTPTDEGNVASVPLVTRDHGATWSEFPYPCDSEHRLLGAAELALFAVCPSENGTTVHRSLDLRAWKELGTFGPASVVPLAADVVLLTGAESVVLTDDGALPADLPLTTDASVWDAIRLDRLYLATGDGVLASDDGGRTWRPAG